MEDLKTTRKKLHSYLNFTSIREDYQQGASCNRLSKPGLNEPTRLTVWSMRRTCIHLARGVESGDLESSALSDPLSTLKRAKLYAETIPHQNSSKISTILARTITVRMEIDDVDV